MVVSRYKEFLLSVLSVDGRNWVAQGAKRRGEVPRVYIEG